MSNAVFPSLPGLGFGVQKEPEFSTLIQSAVTGKELRISERAYPLWHMSLVFDFLRDTNAFPEIRSLLGFYLARLGPADNFLFTDPDDSAVTAQALGTGTGAQQDFQLLREYGGFIEPVFNPNVITTVFLNGTPTGAYTLQPNGVIRFTVAPGAGVVVTVTYSYYFRCRFKDDRMSLIKFLHQVWKAGRVPMVGSLQDKI